MTNLAVTIFAGFAQFFVTWLTALGHSLQIVAR